MEPPHLASQAFVYSTATRAPSSNEAIPGGCDQFLSFE